MPILPTSGENSNSCEISIFPVSKQTVKVQFSLDVLGIILFHDDNAQSYTWNIAQAKRHELGFESLCVNRILQTLAPSDYYCGRHFESNEEVEWGTEGNFEEFDKSYYLEGIEKLKDRWTRIELKRDYIKK